MGGGGATLKGEHSFQIFYFKELQMKYVIIGIIPDVQIRVNIQEFVTSHSFTFYFQGNFTDSQRNAIYMFGMI